MNTKPIGRQVQNQSAKLGKIYEEAIFRCHKIEFFSWSSVYFILYLCNVIVINCVNIRSFGDVLSDKFVRMLDVPSLSKYHEQRPMCMI